MTSMRYDDDVVIVTGAGRGLGREYALAFASRGAAVVVNDLGSGQEGQDKDISIAQSVVDEILAAGGRAIANTSSVADADGAQEIVEAAIEAFGKATVLVNNAGVIDYALLPDITDAAWNRMIDVTLRGTFNMSRAIWPHFVSEQYGRIVNTTSNVGFAGNELLTHYGAAKLGVAGLTRALAQEVGEADIRVNAVAPMAVTRMNRDAFFEGKESASENWVDDIEQGRVPMGPPSIVAPTVLWLAHRSSDMNGEIFSTSSGKVARVAFVIGSGHFDPAHTPEALRDNAAKIRDVAHFFEPRNSAEEIASIPPLFA